MAFSRLFSSLKSLNKSTLRNSLFHTHRPHHHIKTNVISSDNKQTPNVSWLSSLLPVAIAFSAGSFAFKTLDSPALCDSSNLHAERYSITNYYNSTLLSFCNWHCLVIIVFVCWLCFVAVWTMGEKTARITRLKVIAGIYLNSLLMNWRIFVK